jgi:hypothetical protein
MRIAYVTGDVTYNKNFAFFHDLLANYPVPDPRWSHRVYLIHPNWRRELIYHLRNRCVESRCCYEEFHPSH